MANNQQLLLGEGAGSAPAVFVEDVFSAYVYAGSNSSLTITNNIDLSTKGGLIWVKARTTTYSHKLTDTVRGGNRALSSNNSGTAGNTVPPEVSSFNTTGFTLEGATVQNNGGYNFVSWTFREQPKFFDIVTYTGTGSNTTFAHSLGSVPGCIIVKRTDIGANWAVYHRSIGNSQYLVLNTTAAGIADATWWNNTTPTSSVFSVGTDASVNASGGTYVAYIFAHDAGGFGLAGTDNVISCGTASATAGTWSDVNVGFEPQWVLLKNSTAGGTYNPSGSAGSEDWFVIDTMRGATAATNSNTATVALSANSSIAEYNDVWFGLTSTGFSFKGVTTGSDSFIYIAIRRGPMKVPTVGTSVYQGVVTGASNFPYVITNTVVDFAIRRANKTTTQSYTASSRLTGDSYLLTTTTDAETAGGGTFKFDSMSGWYNTSLSATPVVWNFGRAPGFFDVVCYTGTGSATTFTHNLTVAPELMIIKNRSVAGRYWAVYSANRGVSNALALNQDSAEFSGTSSWNGTAPTNSVFTVNTHTSVNESGATYVAYLFATLAGVSKVGTYTGTGTTQVINCGFTSSARFVLIKRTDSTGDWYVWDSARGIIAGNDPYLLLNSTAAEVTSTDYIDTDTTGFEISSTAPAAINASAGTFIFWAVA